jgi:short-subunit dehydrogenase
MNTEKKYTMITGATSGIGYELTKLFAKDGHNLILVARTQVDLDKCAEEMRQHGVEVYTISKDLMKPEAPYEIFDEVKERGIVVDILVNDAGQGEYGLFIDNDLQRELDIIQLNVIALTVLTKLFVKEMVSAGSGKVLNLASIASKIPGPWQAVYHGTKAYVHFLTEAIRQELKDTGVTLTSLLPGATDTDFFHKADMERAKIVQETDLSDPAKVAKDGYDALMAGDDMVISGFKNKMNVKLNTVLPDSMATKNLGKLQEPVDKD